MLRLIYVILRATKNVAHELWFDATNTQSKGNIRTSGVNLEIIQFLLFFQTNLRPVSVCSDISYSCAFRAVDCLYVVLFLVKVS